MNNRKYAALEAATKKIHGPGFTTLDLANYFLSVGTDLKGQNQICYRTLGCQAEITTTIDPLSLHTAGVFSASIKLNGQGSVLDKTLIVVQIGPKSIGTNYQIQTPVMINFCAGTKYAGSMSASLFVGLNYGAGSDALGARATLTAGGSAAGQITGEYFYAENRQPLPFRQGDRETLTKTLTALFEATTFKEFLKKPAVEFIKSKGIKPDISYNRINLIGKQTHITTESLTSALDKAYNLSPEDRRKAESLSDTLKKYKNKEDPSVRSCIRIFSGAVTGGAGLSLEASASIDIAGFTMNAASENKFSDIQASYKPIFMRMQSAYPATHQLKGVSNPCWIVMTQDITLSYYSYKFTLASSSNSIKHQSHTIAKKEFSTEVSRLNGMNYVAATIYWATPLNIHPFYTRNQKTNQSKVNTSSDSLSGSGISFGASYLFDDLEECILYNHKQTELKKHVPVIPAVRPNTRIDENSITREWIKAALDDFSNWFDARSIVKLGLSSKPTAYTGLRSLLDSDKLRDAVRWVLSIPRPDLSQEDQQYFRKVLKEPLRLNSKVHDYVSETKTMLRTKLLRTVSWSEEEIQMLIRDQDNINEIIYLKRVEQENKAIAENRDIDAMNDEINEMNLELEQYTKRKKEFIEALAKRINLTSEEFFEFLMECKDYVIGHDQSFPGIKSVILESGFRMESRRLDIESSLIKNKGFMNSTVTGEQIELSPSTAAKMKEDFNKNLHPLNVVRMRYRMEDRIEEKRTVFKLGFEAVGQGIESNIQRIQQSGSEGIVDIHTKWYGIISVDESTNYNEGIPAVALFAE